MQKLRNHLKSNPEAGFTLVELLVSLVITAILAVGVTRILTITMQTVGYTQSSTLVASNTALIDSVLSEDISDSNGFVIPNTTTTTPDSTKICTSWISTDTGFTSARPLLTLSVPSYLPITSAKGNGLSITYSLAMGTTNTFQVGQLATIYGFSNPNLTSISAAITSKTDSSPTQAGTFTVATTISTTEAETPAKNGTAAVNWFHGYEIRSIGGTGELWLVTCPVTGSTTNLSNPRVLRQGVPLPNDVNWANMVKCTSFSSGTSISVAAASSTSLTCPTNTSLTSLIDNPGIQFIIPPAAPGSRSNQYYKVQVIQGARSIA